MTHLTLVERYEISILDKQGRSKAEISRAIGRHWSTIGSELKRNAGSRHMDKNKHGDVKPGIRGLRRRRDSPGHVGTGRREPQRPL